MFFWLDKLLNFSVNLSQINLNRFLTSLSVVGIILKYINMYYIILLVDIVYFEHGGKALVLLSCLNILKWHVDEKSLKALNGI